MGEFGGRFRWKRTKNWCKKVEPVAGEKRFWGTRGGTWERGEGMVDDGRRMVGEGG